MAITVAERWSARKISRGTNKCASVEYVIAGTDDDGAAADALDSFITSNSLESWDGIPLQTKELEQIADRYGLPRSPILLIDNRTRTSANIVLTPAAGHKRLPRPHRDWRSQLTALIRPISRGLSMLMIIPSTVWILLSQRIISARPAMSQAAP